jgi:hypothetical protein
MAKHLMKVFEVCWKAMDQSEQEMALEPAKSSRVERVAATLARM